MLAILTTEDLQGLNTPQKLSYNSKSAFCFCARRIQKRLCPRKEMDAVEIEEEKPGDAVEGSECDIWMSSNQGWAAFYQRCELNKV